MEQVYAGHLHTFCIEALVNTWYAQQQSEAVYACSQGQSKPVPSSGLLQLA